MLIPDRDTLRVVLAGLTADRCADRGIADPRFKFREILRSDDLGAETIAACGMLPLAWGHEYHGRASLGDTNSIRPEPTTHLRRMRGVIRSRQVRHSPDPAVRLELLRKNGVDTLPTDSVMPLCSGPRTSRRDCETSPACRFQHQTAHLHSVQRPASAKPARPGPA
jgi:hypothetical protein